MELGEKWHGERRVLQTSGSQSWKGLEVFGEIWAITCLLHTAIWVHEALLNT